MPALGVRPLQGNFSTLDSSDCHHLSAEPLTPKGPLTPSADTVPVGLFANQHKVVGICFGQMCSSAKMRLIFFKKKISGQCTATAESKWSQPVFHFFFLIWWCFRILFLFRIFLYLPKADGLGSVSVCTLIPMWKLYFSSFGLSGSVMFTCTDFLRLLFLKLFCFEPPSLPSQL